MDLMLERRVYFVTGGSRGIGKEIVLALLREGAYVAACARNKETLDDVRETLADEMQERCMTFAADVRSESQMQEAIEKTRLHFGRLDGIVANAGFGCVGGVLDTDLQEWARQYEIKLAGVLAPVKAAMQALKQSDAGRIVLINGVTANLPDGEMAAVSAARAAVKQVAFMLAKQLAPDRICVNTVNLGAIDTERQKIRYEKSGSALPYRDWAREEAVRRGIALERFGTPEEVAPLVLFLLSPLSSYITASTVDVAGGLHALP